MEAKEPEERDGEVKILVRLTIQDRTPGPVGEYEQVTSDIEIWLSKGGCVAELKALLESQDALPSTGDDGDAYTIEVRLPETTRILTDEDILPQNATMVYLYVGPKNVPRNPPPVPRLTPNPIPYAAPARPSFTDFFPSTSMEPNPEMMQRLMNNPQSMRQMMNSPMVRSLMSNPEIMRTLMESNPQMRELRERNPELNHLLNDPELLRQSLEAIQNPGLMREMISNTDRALSNIDAVPGGFDALRRVYKTIQEPIWDATVSGANPQSGGAKGGKDYDLQTDKGPSTEAIPNPWARQAPTRQAPSVIPTRPPIRPAQRPVLPPRSAPILLRVPESAPTRILPAPVFPAPVIPTPVIPAAPAVQPEEPPVPQPAVAEASVPQPSVPIVPELKSDVETASSSAEEPVADTTPGGTRIETQFPFSVQSFFPSQFNLRSLGGIGFPHAAHITGVRHTLSSQSSREDVSERDAEKPTEKDEAAKKEDR